MKESPGTHDGRAIISIEHRCAKRSAARAPEATGDDGGVLGGVTWPGYAGTEEMSG